MNNSILVQDFIDQIWNNKAFEKAETGNASNPSPKNISDQPVNRNQLLDEKAEKYLRESANIEDEPDAQDQEDADETMKK